MSHSQSNVDSDKYYKEMNGAKNKLEKNLEQGIVALYEKDKNTFEWGKNLCVWSLFPISFNKVIEKLVFKKFINILMNIKEKLNIILQVLLLKMGIKIFIYMIKTILKVLIEVN